MTHCFPLNSSYSEISNNKYIFNNNYTTNISYGVYETSYNLNYIIRNVSKNYPLTFYDSSTNSSVSNILQFEPLNKNVPILIYVSKGQDYSFNNNDFFRFYDTSFQILNINHSRRITYDSSLTDVHSNFYFMNKQTYKFIATTDFCSNQPFRIYGNAPLTIDYSLSSVGASFEITIPYNADNSSNKLFYSDINPNNTTDVCGNLFILRDLSYSYYYGDISFSITNYRDVSRTYISLKSYNFSYSTVSGYGTVSISNNNLFYYSESCGYITQGYSRNTYELLNKISAIDLSINANNTFKVGLNKNRHIRNATFNYDLSYGLTIKDYIIIDISKNYPLRLLNNEISNNIYIDETYQVNRLGIHTISGSKFYYGSLKIKVVGAFIVSLNVQFVSISNNSIDSSYIVTFIYDSSNTPLTLNHIVYDSSSNSRSYYDFSNTNLQLINQYGILYNDNSYSDASNIFKLNLNTNYTELYYNSRDKLSNDLTRLVSITPSIDLINNELSNNFINKPFYIYYNVIDYENNSIQNIRIINLNSGPIIEISNNYNNNNNNNSIFNFNINTNSNANSYNFYDDIKVYIYDKSKNKIFIPFEITLSGNYISTTDTRIRNTISKVYNYDNTLNNIQNSIQNRYYSTFYTNITFVSDQNVINLTNIDFSSITINNSNTSLLTNIDNINSSFKLISYYNNNDISINITDSSKNFINKIRFQKPGIITGFAINNSFDASFIIYNFNLYTSGIYKIDVSLGLNPTKFFFNVYDTSLNAISISGNFVKPKFFIESLSGSTAPTDYIDLSYIGNYDLAITTKSLTTSDYYWKTYSANFFDVSIINITKTYTIRVEDTSSPSLTFYDISGRISTNLKYFKLVFPKTSQFRLLEDICFARLSNFISRSNEYVDNKPVLLYVDNSIYDLCKNDLSVSFTTSPDISFRSNTNDLSVNNSSINDASCIITYKVRDLCYNYSTGISLELNFINIPYITLSGQSIVTLNYVNDLTYVDAGLTFITPPSIYNPTGIYNKSTLPTNLTDTSNFVIGGSTYSISGTSDICFSRLGNYYFKYTIQEYNSPNIVRLQRLIKIVDTSRPSINFPTINFTIDGSAGLLATQYNTIANIRNKNYSIDNSATTYIDLSFTVNTYFDDLSSVLYNFDLCDNYFNTTDLSSTIRVFNNSNSFVFSDISNYCDISGRLNKVTYPVRNDISNSNYAVPIIFKYTLIDGCNNSFVFNRIVNIRDDTDPSINFNFTTCYNNVSHTYRDYSYVQFTNSNRDFSYVAFNYTKSQTPSNTNNFDFNAEISSIVLDYTISDNFGTIGKTPKNVTITVSGSSLLLANNKTININAPTSDNSINELFSRIGSSFKLVYDISDNQNNHIPITRNVTIVDAIGDPSRNFEFSYSDAINALTISFGDTNLIMKEGIDISVNHLRLTNSDISYDISYRFVNSSNNNYTPSLYINSISGNKLYDPSALIYNLGPFNSGGVQAREFSHNILYYPISANSPTTDVSNYKTLTVTVKNSGPIINFGISNEISHQSYTPLTDASFLFGVTSFSSYDEFYYYRYKQDISYNGTNFKVILDSSLNVNDPSSGNYNIIYYSKDSNNVDISKIRTLRVSDSQAPFIRSICGDNIYQTTSTVWSLDFNSVYIEYGALVYDSATKQSYYFNNETRTTQTETLNGVPYNILDGIKYSIRYNRITTSETETSFISITSINTTSTDICYQVIYSIFDLCNNEISDNRIIRISRSYRPLLYPYIEVNSNSVLEKFYLLRDLSNNDISLTRINKVIPSNGTLNTSYDLSLSFVNNNSTKIIICEAIKPIVFNKTMNSNYIRFKLHAKSYDGSRNSYSTNINPTISSYVDYSINSTRVFNSPIDYQVITFYAIDSCQNILEQQQSITFYLKIIHTKPYTVKKLTNINFSDSNRLEYPLLSRIAITTLISNINYFDSYENSYLNYINYYKKVPALNSDTSNIVLIDPGINIDDIVDGTVNYINDAFEPSNNSYIVSDISVTYFKAPSYIDVSYVLTLSGQYIQNYNIKDKANTILDVSRVIVVKPFAPIIRLNYQKDANGNDYVSYLSQKYEKFIEKAGYVRDFSDIDISFTNVAIDYSNLNENSHGSYTVAYSVTNSSNIQGTAKRNVEVYTPIVLEKIVKHSFINLISSTSNFNSNLKYSLGNGIYNFDVSSNYAFKLVTRDFDTSMIGYDVSNLINITSDVSYSLNGETYYYGSNVILTISGDFERCSLKFYSNTSTAIAQPFKSYLKNNEFRYFFIYDNANYFINLQSYYANLRDVNSAIDTSNSFIVDVSNLNNSVSSLPPYFTINGLKQDLHLSYGVYRFQQTTSKNFYNPIKFSITPDGTHNGGIEYTKTVFSQNLPGVSRPSPLLSSYNISSIYTQISINATTPTILYYYSEKFKNMGGKIVVKNNIVFLKNVIILNSFILTNQTRTLFNNSNGFLNISNEIMQNRIILNNRFDVSANSVTVNTISNINICCVTQQNLRYNILYDLKQHPNRVVFQKYTEMSNNNININASPYYLLDVSNSNLNFNDSYNTYITYFNSIYESSYALIKTPSLSDYDRSLKNVFYNSAIINSTYTINSNNNTSITSANNANSANANSANSANSANASLLNNEILNYINFFKRNNVFPSKLLVKDFSYSISEFLFARPSAILNLDSSNIYNYSSVNTSYLLAPRIKATNIINNYAMFALDVDYANLHFQTFEVLLYSSSFTSSTISPTTISNDRLVFLNGSLVIANNMLYSTDVSGFYDGSSIFNKIYENSNNRETTIQNMVFLNIIDASSTSTICGLTKQNIYNNMYLDESNNFIFHKYNEDSVVNYQVNDSNLTLAKTLSENSNNDYYLLDVCSNSFYNSFNNDGLTLSTLTDLGSDKNYSISLSYKIYDEVDVSTNFNMLASLYLLPAYLNNIPVYRRINNVYSTYYTYNSGSYKITNNGITSDISINAISTLIYGNYSYNSNSNPKTILNGLHSNSYLIDLNDYFDVNLVANRFQTECSFNTNIINPNNLIYTLTDLSYNNDKFSLINIETSYNIVYDKVNIAILNTMQIKVFCLHFKFVYLFTILNRIWNKKYTPNIIPYNMTDNIQIYSDLYKDYDYINTSFKSTLSTSSITILYRELIDSIIGYTRIYNDLITNFELYIYIVIVLNPVYSTYTFNTAILTQLVEDINKLVENIDAIILSEQSKLTTSLLLPDSTIFTSYNDISNIEYTLSSFFILYNISQPSFSRWNSTFNSLYTIPIFKSPAYINMFDITNLNPTNFLSNFKYNLNLLADYFNNRSNNNGREGLSITINNNSNIDLQLTSVTTFAQFITKITLFLNHFAPIMNNYYAFEVDPNNIKYINNTFELVGSKILIYSNLSSNINIKFNIKYKSYFFNYIDISSIDLDIIIPDLTPPTLTFTNHDFSFNQNDLIDNSINNVITNLIRDVSYIDLNQRHDISINNTYYSYYKDITNELSSNNIQNSLVSIDIPSTNFDFGTYTSLLIDILYTVKDNANNINTIIRKLIINKSDDGPKFYYFNNGIIYEKLDRYNTTHNLTIDENISVEKFKAELINFIVIIDPRLALSNSYLTSTSIDVSEFNLFYSRSVIDISAINIYDSTNSNILYATYDVTNNKFIDYYNYANTSGKELANSSNIVLKVGSYNLLYISKTSSITNRNNSENRKLTVKEVIVIGETAIVTHCCYPKVEYKPIQDNYKLGSQNSTVMKRAKYIINRNR